MFRHLLDDLNAEFFGISLEAHATSLVPSVKARRYP